MPKTTSDFDPETYAPVAARVELFYERYPNGRILTELVERTEQEIVFRAAVYRAAEDREPAATGWAAERIGDGEVNAVACLENTETSAIGRALANLGFLASRLRPSAEEVAKADRARARLSAEPDLLQLLRTAERAGLSASAGGGAAGARGARARGAGAERGAARAPAVHPATNGGPRGASRAGGVTGVSAACRGPVSR